MNKITILSLVIAIAALVCVFAWQQPRGVVPNDTSAYARVMEKNELVCGIYPWAPAKVFDPNTKEWSGWAIDVYRKAFSTLDIKVTFREVVMGNQIQDLNSGRVDAICDDGPWILSAGKFVEYSDPFFYAVVYPYVRKNETRFKSLADLNKKDVRFAGIDSDASSDLVPRLFPQATLLSVPSITDVSQLYLDVASGKVDATIGDPEAFSGYNKNNPGKLVPLFPNNPLGKYKVVVSVKKGDFKMLGLVNQAVDNALAFGLIDAILDRVDPNHERIKRVRSRAVF